MSEPTLKNIDELNTLLAECGCCEMPHCCPPMVERQYRICEMGAGGYLPFNWMSGEPGSEVETIYRRVDTKTHHRWEGSASQSIADPDFPTHHKSGTAGYLYDRKTHDTFQILEPTLLSERPWIFCVGEDITVCTTSYKFTSHTWGSCETWNVGPGAYNIERITQQHETSINLDSDASIEAHGCESTTTELSNTASGDGSFFPTPPYSELGIGYDAPSESDGACFSTATSREHVLISASLHTTDTDESGDDDHYEFTGDASILSNETWELTVPLTYSALAALAREKLDSSSVPWTATFSNAFFSLYGDSGDGAVFAKVFWPTVPIPDEESDSESEPEPEPECDHPHCLTGRVMARSMRYRIKLNKCCRYTEIRSEWDEIFFPREYLEWLQEVQAIKDASLSDDDEDLVYPPNPGGVVVTPKVWAWSGTPPGCDDSGSSLDESDLDTYSDETMWSPWSSTVKVPADKEGIVVLRNYQQRCYGSIPDFMPGVFGDEIDTSDSKPDAP